jgi:hypothetical protein
MTASNRKPAGMGAFAAQVTANQRSAVRPQIGQILIEAGFIDQPALEECLTVARQTSQPVCRIVSMMNYVSERDVESALFVQSMIGQGALSKQRAIQSLKEASRRKIAVVELLNAFGSEAHTDVASETDIGKLLIESRLITHDQLAHALSIGRESGLLLIRSLLVTNAITVPMASKALNAMAQVKAGKITYLQAVAVLDEIRRSNISLRDAVIKLRFPMPERENSLLLGEMIARGGLSTDIEILEAVEVALTEGKKLGETLVSCNIVSTAILESALELQELSSKCVLGSEQAVFVLKRLHQDNLTLEQLAVQTDLFEDKSQTDHEVLRLVVKSGEISEQDVLDAVKAMGHYRMGPVKALLATGKMSVALYNAAQDLACLLLDRKVEECDGIAALRLCHNKGLYVTSALASLGRSPNTQEIDAPVEFQRDENSKETVRARQKRWFSMLEFRLLMSLIMATPVACYFCFWYAPEPWNVNGLWGILAVALLFLILIWLSWRSSAKSLSQAAFQSADSARETKARLTKIRK